MNGVMDDQVNANIYILYIKICLPQVISMVLRG